MSLARSKSAPNPLVDAVDSPRPPISASGSASSSTAARPTSKRLRWLLDDLPPSRDADNTTFPNFTSSPLTSPRRDYSEDPFSLAGFFPSRPDSPSANFAWLSTDIEHDDDGGGGGDGTNRHESARTVRFAASTPTPNPNASSSLPAKRSLSMTALDEYAKQVIASEDKMGILSPLGIARLPSFFVSIGTKYFEKDDNRRDDDDAWEDEHPDITHPPTPSSIDEAFDADSLYASICLRRAASETVEIAAAGPRQTLELFSPDASGGVVAHAGELEVGGSTTGWASSLYAMVVGNA